MPFLFSLVALVGCALAGGCCVRPHPDLLIVNAPVAKAGVVFVADGAGNFQNASFHVRKVVEASKEPLDVVTFEWSHGHYRVVADQVDYAHARAEGYRLASTILRFRQDHPDVPVYLLGHSAGAMVVIVALELLPENSVERVVLFSAAVSATFDILPALRAVKCGLHNFYSRADNGYLGVAVGILGTSDRQWGPSSGRYGFRTSPRSPENAHLLDKLHQRPWKPFDCRLGNFGGHYGNYQPDFVRKHVLPLFCGHTSRTP